MRDHYDFSNGIRGKYAGKVDTTNIRILDPAKPVDPGEIRHKRGDTLVGALRKRAGGESLSKGLKQK
jgi:hypothetical protein